MEHDEETGLLISDLDELTEQEAGFRKPFFLSLFHVLAISVPLAFGISKTVLNMLGHSLASNSFDIFLSFLAAILYVLSLAEGSLEHRFWWYFFRFNLWPPVTTFFRPFGTSLILTGDPIHNTYKAVGMNMGIVSSTVFWLCMAVWALFYPSPNDNVFLVILAICAILSIPGLLCIFW
ncbi:hypothetical protein DL93DRAFT_1670134 [Clavulina sp. PMI_390]|nr:hypothetical protein DL93DRAFT_1670134 [Clavulina sp. PMI_390]